MPVGEVYAASWQSSGAQYPVTRDLPARHSVALNQLTALTAVAPTDVFLPDY
jgi:hypothetical protein